MPDDSEASGTYRLTLTVADGRTSHARFEVAPGYERMEPYGIEPIAGRHDAFVLLLAEVRGEDCVERSIVAYFVDLDGARIRLERRRPIGAERVAFDACIDAPAFAFIAEGRAVRMRRTVHRIRVDDADDAMVGLCEFPGMRQRCDARSDRVDERLIGVP